jgi:hypothetical protein
LEKINSKRPFGLTGQPKERRPHPLRKLRTSPIGKMADKRVATFGTSANALNPATMKRIKQVLEKNKTLGLTAANCADFAIKMASSWMKDSTERTLDSAQRGWKTFCHIFEFPPLIDGLAVEERESIAVAYVGYMVQTIKAARGDQPAAGTLQNYITAVRRLHDRHGVRFDVFSTAEMPILAFVLKKVCQHLKAHAPLAAAKPLVPLKLFLRHGGHVELVHPRPSTHSRNSKVRHIHRQTHG